MLCICYFLTFFVTKNRIGSRYDTVLEIRKWAKVFLICILISCFSTKIANIKYENETKQMQECKMYVGVILSNPTCKEYATQYVLRVKKIGNKKANITVYVLVKGENHFKYGDEIYLEGEYLKPEGARNEKGFHYEQYLKSNRNCSER